MSLLKAGMNREATLNNVVSVRLDGDVSLALTRIANRWRRSVNEIMRSVLSGFVGSVEFCLQRSKPLDTSHPLIAIQKHKLQDTERFLLDGVLDGPEKDHLTDHEVEEMVLTRELASVATARKRTA